MFIKLPNTLIKALFLFSFLFVLSACGGSDDTSNTDQDNQQGEQNPMEQENTEQTDSTNNDDQDEEPSSENDNSEEGGQDNDNGNENRVEVDPPDLPKDDQGWTELALHPDSKQIYVSADALAEADGLSESNPAPLNVVLQMIAPGDHVLFKRGDTFGELPWPTAAGLNADYPTVFGAYGEESLPRPVFTGGLSGNGSDAPSNLFFVDLEIHDGISFKLPYRNITFEGVLLLGGEMSAQGWEEEDTRAKNLKLFRTVIADAPRGQGLFCDDVDGITIEESVFDRNGYSETNPPNKFNHNIYIQKRNNDVTLKNTITARASSHGFQLRPHGIVEGVLSIANPLAGFISQDNAALNAEDYWPSPQLIRNSVALHGITRQDAAPADFAANATGFQMFGGDATLGFPENAICENNIVAFAQGDARKPLPTFDQYSASSSGNVIHEWDDDDDGNNYVEPRGIPEYMEHLGWPEFASVDDAIEAFMQEARNNRKGDWTQEYTAEAAISWIQDGFQTAE